MPTSTVVKMTEKDADKYYHASTDIPSNIKNSIQALVQMGQIAGDAGMSLPGADIIGNGFDISQGFNLNSLTSSILLSNNEKVFSLGEDVAYTYPSYQVARQIFDTKMTTRVFDSVEAETMSLAVSASVDLSYGMFKGKASGSVKLDQQSAAKLYISQSDLDVKMYALDMVDVKPGDVNTFFMDEFMTLPLEWSRDPKRYQDFVRKWGTHVVKSVEVGGRLSMRGEIRNSENLDGLQIAAQIELQFQTAALQINARASAEYGRKFTKSVQDSSFTYSATGGDPTVAGLIASKQSTSDNAGDALIRWLDSLKQIPKVYAFTLMELPDLIFTGGDDQITARRDALRQAISVYLSEGFINAVSATIKPKTAFFSNFFQISSGRCLRFSAALGAADKLNIVFSAVPSRSDTGYRVVVDNQRASVRKGKDEVKATTSLSALAPGNSLLYSIYFVCYSNGKLLYGRRDRTQLVFTDSNPQEVYFFGFDGVDNTGPVYIADLRVTAYDGLSCPGVFSKEGDYVQCNDQGTCSKEATCKCNKVAVGFACQFMCPIGLADQPCSGETRGDCLAPTDEQQDLIKVLPATCKCKSPSILGDACQHDCPIGPNNQICSGKGNCRVKDDNSAAECVCQPGFLGRACEFPCPLVDNKVCNDKGSCALDNPSKPTRSKCFNCANGFGGDNCADINECDTPNLCGQGGTCVNTVGSYECRCSAGYVYNNVAKRCENMNECNNPSLNNCHRTAGVCTDTTGGYTCSCAFGFKGDGRTCDYVDWTMSGVAAPLPSNLAFNKVGAKCPPGTAFTSMAFQRGGATVFSKPPGKPNVVIEDPNVVCGGGNIFARISCISNVNVRNAARQVEFAQNVANWERNVNQWRIDMIDGGVRWEDGKINFDVANLDNADVEEGLIAKLRCAPVPGGIAEGNWITAGIGAPMASHFHFDRLGGVCPDGQIARGFGFVRGGANVDSFWGQGVVNTARTNNQANEGLAVRLLCAPSGAIASPRDANWVATGTGAPLTNHAFFDRVGGQCPPGTAAAGFQFRRGGYNRAMGWTDGIVDGNCAPTLNEATEGLTVQLLCVRMRNA
eukprot:GILI01000311.1.p1 GENE.GILI01000311.1~~GILI01000311.1.p1  ORF type:complete len:1136 (-),score=343.84 GILI01000311.1:74-3292(-)